jgi:hypothetical protein
MKTGLLTICICMGALSSAAHADAPPANTTDGQQARTPQPIYKSIWREDGQGNIVHLQSGLACDARIGDLRLTEVHAYKPSGLDVSCNYLDPGHSDITMYLTRRGTKPLDDDFVEAEREFQTSHPDASPIAAPAGAPATAKSSFYLRQAAAYREGIWIQDIDGWTLEFRGTWHFDQESATFAGISALIAKATGSAGPRLGLCARLPTPVRDGVLVTGKEDIQNTLVSDTIVGAAAEAGLNDANIKTAEPVFCAEDVVGDGDDAMLLWHGVGADGSDALVDQVTPFTLEVPGAVTSSASPALNMILSEEAKTSKTRQRWAITFANDQGLWTFAYYDGRPPAEALAKLAAEIRDHKAKALGGYSAKGKSITIIMPEKN